MFELEKYLVLLKDVNIRKNFSKLRISAHNLNIEVGRHKRPTKLHEIEDEFHYVLKCKKCRPNDASKKLLKNMYKCS